MWEGHDMMMVHAVECVAFTTQLVARHGKANTIMVHLLFYEVASDDHIIMTRFLGELDTLQHMRITVEGPVVGVVRCLARVFRVVDV